MKSQGVAAVKRALKILFVFRHDDRGLPLAEIARRTGFYKSTILRLTKTLCEYGFLTRLSDGKYCLGSALLHLGSLYKESFHLEEVIVPALTDLMEATGETATFYIRQGEMRVCFSRVDSPELLRQQIMPGQSMPLDNTATAKVFRLMEAKTPPKGSRVPIYTAGITDPLTASCATPLITSGGVFLGVITVSGPTARFTWAKRKAAGRKLIGVARKLAIQLGGLPSIY
jgi:DNA-binding IclR family transcriptional regulator